MEFTVRSTIATARNLFILVISPQPKNIRLSLLDARTLPVPD
jgi:hypothetical protein